MRTVSGVEVWQPNAEAVRDLTQDQQVAYLRAHGCPENLAQRVVEKRFKAGYSRKETISATPTADLAFKIGMLRKASRAMGQHLIEIASRDCPNCAGGGDDRAKMIRGHLEVAAQMLENAFAGAETVEGMLNDWDDEDSLRSRTTSATYQSREKFREMHKQFFRMIGEVCLHHAQTRLTANEIFD